ncbi:MAG: hypothetical protein J6T74_03620 [Clostridia bacterium]|nr:hypothetical protein [Clostridia bacterium]MBO7715908.1 hypothetical protein [Methanobrevibacter sp.]
MRLIDADALIKRIDVERQYLKERGLLGGEHILVHNFRELVENAPSVPLPDFKEGYKQAIKDKISIKSNGDIIDFDGCVVGHINLDIMKGGSNG